MRAEDKVKAVFPQAEIKYDLVIPKSKWDWSTEPMNYQTLLALGVWVDGECLAYGGKYEYKIWGRAWKVIQRRMLKKLEG